MAYAVDPNQQQNQQQPLGTAGQTPQAPVATSSAPGAGPGGSKTPTGAATSSQTAQPFTNLQAYLTANAPQVAQQANTISGNLTNQYGQIQNDVNAGVGQFNQQVQAGYTPENANLVQQAAANPTQFVQDPNNVKAFQSQLNDQYTGPTNFEGTAAYAPLNAEVTQGAANANLVNTPAGLQTYLQGSEKNPTQGENMLDSVLLQQSPEAIQQVQAAAQPFSQLPQYLSSQVATADQAAQAAPGAAQQAAANAASRFTGPTGVIPTFTNALTQGAQTAEGQRTSYNQGVNDYYSQATPLEQLINAYAGSIPNGGTIANLFAPIISGNQPIQTPISPSNYATPDEYAEAAALQQLMGNNLNLPINQSTVGQAGTASPIPNLPPTVNSTLGQYAPLINKDFINALANPANFTTGDTTRSGIVKKTSDLVKYLSSIDPENYQWSQGSTPIGDFSFNPAQ